MASGTRSLQSLSGQSFTTAARLILGVFRTFDRIQPRRSQWDSWGRLRDALENRARLVERGRAVSTTCDIIAAERMRTLARRLFVAGDIHLLESENLALRIGASPEVESPKSLRVYGAPPLSKTPSGDLKALRAVAERLSRSGELGIAVRCLQEALDISQEGLGVDSNVTREVRSELAHAYSQLGLVALAKELSVRNSDLPQ